MIKDFFVRRAVIARLESGPLAVHLPLLASTLQEFGYATKTVRRYLRNADRYARWLMKAGVSLATAGAGELSAYRRSAASNRRRDRTGTSGLERVTELLRPAGVLNHVRRGPADDWLDAYAAHLRNVRGLSAASCEAYVRNSKHLVTELFPQTTPDWSSLTAERISEWVRRHTESTVTKFRPVVTMRGVLRYLVSLGDVEPTLLRSIPSIPQRLYATLPKRLTAEEWQLIIDGCTVADNGSRRDRAIVLLLARLGLRAGEVRQLRLEDIDWRAGTIAVRRGKARRERRLPLPEDAGTLLADYLRQERPRSNHREVFLGTSTPHLPFRTSAVISRLTKRLLNKVGVERPGLGAHHLRHTVASQLVCRGASFKEVADILGHASLTSTGIYAKLDEQALSQVAMPWPGGSQ